MYLELLTTALIIQQGLADAYVASGRVKGQGLYFLTLNYTTVAFFKELVPPENFQTLHKAFLEWQKMGIEVLTEELETGGSINAEKVRQYVEASQRFKERLAAITTSSTP